MQQASTDTTTRNLAVDVWFDPVCPWTWKTSRWLRAVAPQRGLQLRWHLMSLALLGVDTGQGPDDASTPGDVRAHLRDSQHATRVLAAASRDRGEEILDPLYRALGERVHEDGRAVDAGVLVDALHDVQLPDSLADLAEDPSQDSAVRASHEAGQRRVGTQVGSPVVGVGSARAFFGPVVTRVPQEAEGLQLWDGLALLAGAPAFAEVKRGR